MDVFDRDFDMVEFYELYWRWLLRGEMTVPVSEDIERIYRQRQKHVPKACPHGRTILTCGDCYFSGWRGE